MLFNRIQSTSSLFNQTQFNFATKSLKIIKLRMKAVESIRKITKVFNLINNYLGHEDGGSIKNEARRWKTRKSKIFWSWISSKSY